MEQFTFITLQELYKYIYFSKIIYFLDDPLSILTSYILFHVPLVLSLLGIV